MSAGLLLACAGFWCAVRSRRSPRRSARSADPTCPTIPWLERYVADDPEPRRFYQVQPGDDPMGVVAAAFAAGGRPEPSNPEALEYLHTICSGPRWNMRLNTCTTPSRGYPDAWLVPVKRLSVRPAFRPIHDDQLQALLECRWPTRSCDEHTGAPRPGGQGRRALLWLPDLPYVGGAVPTWADGSSTIDPPPELLALLDARAGDSSPNTAAHPGPGGRHFSPGGAA